MRYSNSDSGEGKSLPPRTRADGDCEEKALLAEARRGIERTVTVIYCGLSLVLALTAAIFNWHAPFQAGELHLPSAFTVLAAANLVMLEIWRICHHSRS